MIGKATTIPYGFNDLSYIRGESTNKKHPEKIFFVKNNLLDDALDSEGIYDAMKSRCEGHPRMSRKVIRIELYPQAENTKDFTMDDWRKLWDDFIAEFDKQKLRDARTGKVTSGKTNLAGSLGTVWLHRESHSGIPHLHGAYCRVDEDGHCNDAHNIHIRAKKAAEAVAIKRGWKTAEAVRFVRLKEARTACEEALRNMNSWSWNAYCQQLAAKGFKLNVRTDSTGKVVGYAVKKGNTTYNASKLGTHTLTAAHIEATWKKLHPQRKNEMPVREAERQNTIRHTQPDMDSEMIDYTVPHPHFKPYDIQLDGKEQRVYIPEKASEVFEWEFDESFVENSVQLIAFSVTVFVQCMQLFLQDTGYVPTGGGGTSNDLPKRRKNDDDELWALRCVWYAKQKIVVKPRYRIKR